MKKIKWFFRIIKENFSKEDVVSKLNFNTTLKHLTFNLRRDNPSDGNNNWEYRKDCIITAIHTICPDIVCVQECMPHMWKYLTQTLINSYNKYSAEIVSGKPLDKTLLFVSEGLGILYNKSRFKCENSGMFWLSDTPNKFSRTWGNKTPRICIWIKLFDLNTKKYIYVFNTHLDHKSEDARKKSLTLIKLKISRMCIEPKSIVIIGGDMNYNINSEEHQFMSEYDCNYNHLIDSSINYTFNNFKGETNQFIDIVYFNHDNVSSEVITTSFMSTYLSDHYPVLTTFK